MQTSRRPTSHVRCLPAHRFEAAAEAAALYGALALISAIVFGTLSFHPF